MSKNTVNKYAADRKTKNLPYHIVTFVVAPGIPGDELNSLEADWRKDQTITVNYDVYVKQLGFYGNSTNKPVITAPGIPVSELKALKRRIKHCIKHPKDNVIFTNFDVTVQVV
jgi:hypothetical protein